MKRDPNCTLCPLHEGVETVCIPTTVHRGRPVKVLFVGEAPGGSEDEQGKNFIGPAGQVLRKAIEKTGLLDTPFAIANTVRCRPPGNRTPKVKEVNACLPYLVTDIERLRPEIVVPLGAVALKAVTGRTNITKWAGRTLYDVSPDYAVFPMLHPSYVLRFPERWQGTFDAHFQGLASLCKGRKASAVTYERLTAPQATKRIRALAQEEKRRSYAIDLETNGPSDRAAVNPKLGVIVCAAVSVEAKSAFWWEWPTDPAEIAPLRQALYELFTSQHTMVAHNATYEVKWLLWHVARVVDPAGWRALEWRVEDSLLFHYLLDENSGHGLKVLAQQHTDLGAYDDPLHAWMAETGRRLGEAPVDLLGPYNAADVDATMRLLPLFRDKVMASAGLTRVWEMVLRPAIFSVARAELAGRKVDFDAADRLRRELSRKEEKAYQEIVGSKVCKRFVDDHKGDPKWAFNPNSTLQMKSFFFEYLQVPVIGKTEKGDASVKAAYLEPYRERPLVDAYLKWKEARTLRNNYLEKYLPLVAPDGFLYGSYLLFGTVTGRPASTDPNLQNFAPILRQIVVSRHAGGKILTVDWSQLELRLMSQFSGCKPLLEAYRKRQDVHTLTASLVRTRMASRVVTVEEVAEQHAWAEKNHAVSWRQDYGKRPNFALLYGAMPRRFHLEFGVSLKEAKVIYDAWHDAYPEIERFLSSIHEKAREKGYVRSAFGRVRRVPDVNHEDFKIAMHACLEASNFPIQSLGSDLNTILFTRTCRRLAEEDMVTVGFGMTHDSGDYDTVDEELPRLVEILHEEKTRLVEGDASFLTVPLEIDIKTGSSWGGPWTKVKVPA